ncbi:MAG TPA: hypothetical protein VKD71_05035 [Gemmataceae bacterium]|nr:hypothetical protein [Gemmataceae bacterium]
MNCPKCQAIILSEDVNIQALVAKCRRCHEVFRVTDQLPPANGEVAPAAHPVRVPQPATLVVQDAGDIRVIRRRWFRPMYVFMLFFCIAWDSFLVFWYAMALTVPAGGGFDIIAIVFPICHVAVGVGLTYFVIAGFLNKSYVGVTADGLYVRHRPVPWPGNVNLPTAGVKEVYVERSYTQQSGNRPVQQVYNLNAVAEDGRSKKLLGGLELPEAQYAVQTLNDWLNLPPSRLGIPLTAQR